MKTRFALFFVLAFSLSISAQNPAPEATTASTAGTLTISTKVTYSNPYYYAVWINNTSGAFLRTLTIYGNNTSYYADLAHWNSESARNKVNAVTGATKSATATYVSTWNAMDQANGTVVADGTYPVKIEMAAEAYGINSKYIATTFTKGPASQIVTPTVVSPISAITLTWTPVNTAIDNVEFSKLYNVYPNPVISSVYAAGNNIRGLQICTLIGKVLLSTNEQQLNISKLSRGFYLAVIYAKDGMVVKKIEKL